MVQTVTGMNFSLQGKRVFYITNNSTKTRAEYAEKCVKLGFPASEVRGRQIFLFYKLECVLWICIIKLLLKFLQSLTVFNINIVFANNQQSKFLVWKWLYEILKYFLWRRTLCVLVTFRPCTYIIWTSKERFTLLAIPAWGQSWIGLAWSTQELVWVWKIRLNLFLLGIAKDR